jgi:hypothetical protein
VAFGGFAQAAAGRASIDQRLDQHRHRGRCGIEPVVRHVAAGVGGPQRRPARAHRGQKISVVVDAEEAFKLAGEIGIGGAVLDQGRGAHDPWPLGDLAMGAPGRQQNVGDLGRDRLLVKSEPDLDRQPALRTRIGRAELRDSVSKPECRNLMAVSVGRETEPARRRQTGAGEQREVCGLRSDAVRIGRLR